MAEYARFSFDRMGEMPHVDRIYVGSNKSPTGVANKVKGD